MKRQFYEIKSKRAVAQAFELRLLPVEKFLGIQKVNVYLISIIIAIFKMVFQNFILKSWKSTHPFGCTHRMCDEPVSMIV